MRDLERVSLHALIVASGLAAGFGATAENALAKPTHTIDPRDAKIEMLEKQLEALTAKVDKLEAKTAPAVAAAAQPAAARAPAPVQVNGGATIIAGKPSIQSGDGRFTANLHGVMQFDSANYDQRPAGPPAIDHRRGAAATDTARARELASGTNFRRARIGIDGKLFGDFDYNILYEFGGAGEEDAGHIQELWLQYSGIKPFHLRVGAFPPSIGLEDQASTNGAPFLERPAVADMARSLAGGDFREGGEIWAAGERWFASAAITGRVVGVVNSQATGVTQPFDNAFGLVGRVAFLPLKGNDYLLHLGAHGSYTRPADTGGPDVAAGAVRYGVTFQERPELRVDGTRLVSTSAIDADHASTTGLEVAGQYRNFYIESEYELFDVRRRNVAGTFGNPHFEGYYVEGSWILTGEQRKYNTSNFAFDAPTVDHPFSVENGTFGAIELAARYSTVDLNYHAGTPGTAPFADAIRGGKQSIAALGVNWYLNSAARLMFDYQDVAIDRLSPSAASFGTPAGAQIGQHYDVFSLRSQLAF